MVRLDNNIRLAWFSLGMGSNIIFSIIWINYGVYFNLYQFWVILIICIILIRIIFNHMEDSI